MKSLILFLKVHRKLVALSVAGTIATTALVSYAVAGHPTAAPAPAATASAEPTTALPAPTATLYPGTTGEDSGDGTRIYTPGPTTAPDATLVRVAEKFATAWARPDLEPDQWLAGVGQYATNDYMRPISNIDPAAVPATRITGDAKVIDSRSDQATIEFQADTGTLRLIMVSLVGQWWVSETEWADQSR